MDARFFRQLGKLILYGPLWRNVDAEAAFSILQPVWKKLLIGMLLVYILPRLYMGYVSSALFPLIFEAPFAVQFLTQHALYLTGLAVQLLVYILVSNHVLVALMGTNNLLPKEVRKPDHQLVASTHFYGVLLFALITTIYHALEIKFASLNTQEFSTKPFLIALREWLFMSGWYWIVPGLVLGLIYPRTLGAIYALAAATWQEGNRITLWRLGFILAAMYLCHFVYIAGFLVVIEIIERSEFLAILRAPAVFQVIGSISYWLLTIFVLVVVELSIRMHLKSALLNDSQR